MHASQVADTLIPSARPDLAGRLRPVERRRMRWPADGPEWVTLGVAVACVVATFWYIHRYALNILYFDQFTNVVLIHQARTGTLTWSDLWAQHNENRVLFPNLVVLFLGWADHLNVVAEDWINGLLSLCGDRPGRPDPQATVAIDPVDPLLPGHRPVGVLLPTEQCPVRLQPHLVHGAGRRGRRAVRAGPPAVDRSGARPGSRHRRGRQLFVAPGPPGVAGGYRTALLPGTFGAAARWPGHWPWSSPPPSTCGDSTSPGSTSASTLGLGSKVLWFLAEVANITGGPQSSSATYIPGAMVAIGAAVLVIAGVAFAFGLRRGQQDGAAVGLALVVFGLLFVASAVQGRIGLGLATADRYSIFVLTIWVGTYLGLLTFRDRQVVETTSRLAGTGPMDRGIAIAMEWIQTDQDHRSGSRAKSRGLGGPAGRHRRRGRTGDPGDRYPCPPV